MVRPQDGSTSDDDNPSLPLQVRQLLHSTDSDYETEKTRDAELNWQYYTNRAYNQAWLKNEAIAASALQVGKLLYEYTRPLLEACTSAVDTDVNLVYNGAHPTVVKSNDALQDRIDKKWEREDLMLAVKRGVLFGAVTGDHFKRVIPGWLDGRGDSGTSRIEIYSPEIMTVVRDQHNIHDIEAAKIEYIYMEEGALADRKRLDEMAGPARYVSPNSSYIDNEDFGGQTWHETDHIFTMIITPESYYTFRDHHLHAFPGNPTKTEGGRPLNSWENPLGVVPVVHTAFKDIGRDAGVPTFGPVIDALDSINDLMSRFGNIVKTHAQPVLIAYGINPQSTITKGVTEDGTTVWYVPMPPNFGLMTNTTASRLEYLEMKAENLHPLLEYLQKLHDDMVGSIPELHLKRIVELTVASGYEAKIKLQSLIAKLGSVRDLEFTGTERAFQMALVSDDIKRRPQKDGRKLIENAKDKYDLIIRAAPPLPEDLQMLVSTQATDLGNRVTSRHEILLARGYTDKRAKEIMKEIDDDEAAQALAAMKVQADQAQANMAIQKQQADIQMQQQAHQFTQMGGFMQQMQGMMDGISDPQAFALNMSSMMQFMQTLGLGLRPGGSTLPGAPTPKPGIPAPGQKAQKPVPGVTHPNPFAPKTGTAKPSVGGKAGTPATPKTPPGAPPSGATQRTTAQPNKKRNGGRLRRPNPGRKS